MLINRLLPMLLGDEVGLAGTGSTIVYINNDPYNVIRQHCWSSGVKGGVIFQPGAGPSKVFSSGASAGNVQE